VVALSASGAQVFALFEGVHGLSLTDPASESSAGVSIAFANLIYQIFPANLFGIFTGVSTSPNMLGLIVVACLFSSALMIVKASGKEDHLSPVFNTTLDVTQLLIQGVVRFTPPAVGCLVISAVASNPLDELVEGLRSLGVLVFGCISMMFFHVLAFQTTLYTLIARRSPWTHLKGMVRAVVLGFGSASSAITLPTNMACCEALGYDPSITRFVLSLGGTISMDGTALYYSPVIIWMAAQVGIVPTAGQVVVLAIIATLTSMGAAPTPGAGSAMIVAIWGSVFGSTPVPPQIAYYMAIDWLVDRFRTACNVTGDSFVCGMVNAVTKREIHQRDGEARGHGAAAPMSSLDGAKELLPVEAGSEGGQV